MKATSWAQLDLRSLALFRIILGGLILLDTLWRLPFLREFQTDEGVLPRSELLTSPFADYWICLHLGSGNLSGQVVLSLLTMSLALGLMVGWRTPWMVAGCWVMINSLHARNPFVNDRGDLQLALLLFWALFLPLGARWSMDEREGRPAFGQARGLPAAALVLQFAWIYLFAALLKTGDFWLARGDGLKFSLLSPMFSSDLASWMSTWDDSLLTLLNYGVVAGELFVAFLLLCPIMVSLTRTLAVGLLLLFHLGVIFLFHLGLFPLIGALTALALLPGEVWERFRPEDDPDQPGPSLHPLVRIGIAVFMALALLSNLSTRPEGPHLTRPDWIKSLTERLKLEQRWDLFAPLPPINGAFRLVKLSPEGEEIVLFHGPPGQGQEELQTFPGHRWKMLMLTSIFPEFQVVRAGTARVLAQRYPSPKEGKLRYSFVLKPISEKGVFTRPVIQSLWVEP